MPDEFVPEKGECVLATTSGGIKNQGQGIVKRACHCDRASSDGNILWKKDVIESKCRGTGHGVLKLSDVSGPAVFLEVLDGFSGQSHAGGAIAACDAIEEKFGEDGNVFLSFPQWRELDFDDVEAVEEVFAETPFADFLGEVLVCCGDDADISLECFVASNSGKCAVL